MQLAAFLAPELAQPGQRGWLAKLRQMRAGQELAAHWTHDQMLEAYLNLVPLRGEIQGIGAGAENLFGKRPADMNPNPAASPDALGARACRIAHAADCGAIRAAAGVLTSGERAARSDPALAPHLAVRLLDKPGKRVTSTIDRDVQAAATVPIASATARSSSSTMRPARCSPMSAVWASNRPRRRSTAPMRGGRRARP
jgi:penicillin-binding protein 1C